MDPFYWALILIGLAVIVMAFELFIPSAGILGFVAAGLVLASIVMAFRSSFTVGSVFLLIVMFCIPGLIYGLLKAWPHTPIGKKILLDEPDPQQLLPVSTVSNDLIGQIGVSKTKMLPSGLIVIDGEKMDAVSDGFPIEANQPIIVTAVRFNRIYVQPYESPTAEPSELPARDDRLLTDPFEDLGLDDLNQRKSV